MNQWDMSVSDAGLRAVSGSTMIPAHIEYLQNRRIPNAAHLIGGRTITGRYGQPLLYLPYGHKKGKSYEVGSDSPWLQFKPKNQHLPLFNLDNVDFSRTWILTEGEWDALSAIEIGYENTCSLPDGAVQPNEENPAQSGKLRSIRQAWPKIQAGGGSVILALDNDPAGEATKQVLIDIFGRWRCIGIEWPEHEKGTGLNGQCKDFNEVLLLCGPDALAELIEQAKPLKLEGVFRPSEIPKRPPRVYYSIGIPELDENIRLFTGGLCVLTGHTSHGKTNVLLGMLGHLAQLGLKIGLGTFEAEYWEDILPWYNNWLYGEGANEESLQKTHEWLQSRFVFISHEIEPLKAPATVEWIIKQGQDAKGRFAIDVLAVDPWNKLQHKRGYGENESEYIGRSLAEFRNFAKAYACIVIVSAHPDKESGKEGIIPNGYNITGSANWANAPDHILIVYRPDKTLTTTYINVDKARIRGSGKPGGRWFVFSSRTNRYSPCAEHLIPKTEEKKQSKRKPRNT